MNRRYELVHEVWHVPEMRWFVCADIDRFLSESATKHLLGDPGDRLYARTVRREVDRRQRTPLGLDELLVQRDRAEDRHLVLRAERLDRRMVRCVLDLVGDDVDVRYRELPGQREGAGSGL